MVDTDTGEMGEYNPSQQRLPGNSGPARWRHVGFAGYFNGSVYYGPINDYIKAFQLQGNNTLSPSPDPSSKSPSSWIFRVRPGNLGQWLFQRHRLGDRRDGLRLWGQPFSMRTTRAT